jgi:hypothetical protein
MTDLASIFSNLFTAGDYLLGVKYVLLIVELVYGIFSFVVLRQVSLMNETLQTEIGPFFTLVAYVHFFAVVALFILSIIIL